MSGIRTSPTSTLVDVPYHSMEEVNKVARTTGWQGDFRQLGKGPVTSHWRSLHLGQSSLVSHRVDNRLHVPMAPPEGCVALAIIPPPFSMLVDGTDIGKNEAIVSDVEMNVVTPDECRCDTLVVPRVALEANAQALFPRMSANGGRTRVVKVPGTDWSALQGGFESLLRAGSISPEDLSHLLCRFLDAMARETGERPRETCLDNRSTRRVARLARDYIEEHYRGMIRMHDLCRHTGVSLRTLQRIFCSYFQVSPLNYIKARRLNAARQALARRVPSMV